LEFGETTTERLARKLEERRGEAGLSEERLAATAEISTRTYRKIKKKGANTTLATVDALAHALGCRLLIQLVQPGDHLPPLAASDYLGISMATLDELEDAGEAPTSSVEDGQRLYLVSDLDTWIEETHREDS